MRPANTNPVPAIRPGNLSMSLAVLLDCFSALATCNARHLTQFADAAEDAAEHFQATNRPIAAGEMVALAAASRLRATRKA